MSAQRLFGFLSIAVQVTVLGYFSGTYVFPVCIALIAFSGLFVKQRISINRRLGFWITVGLFHLFVAKNFIAPHDFTPAQSFIRTPLAYAIGQFFIVVQTAQFYIRREDDRLPLSMPAWGIATLVFLGDVQPDYRQMPYFQAAVLVFLALATLFVSSSRHFRAQQLDTRRWSRLVSMFLTLGLALGAGWGASAALRQHEREFDDLISRYLIPDDPPTTAGFSGNSHLGSIAATKSNNEARIALRVYAEESPGYFRGAAFDHYRNPSWVANRGDSDVPRAASLPSGISTPPGEYESFLISKAGSGKWMQFEVWPAASQTPAVFSPLGTALLQAPISQLSRNADDVFHAPDLLQGIPFHVATQQQKPLIELSPSDRERLTRIPDRLDPQVGRLAEQIGGESHSAAEKIAAVKSHFLTNYKYHVGITIPTGAEPLSYFLLEKPDAHCEYFASGTAILLRYLGVPCRYVTGFVVSEKNVVGGFWVARNRHAHAWVEAYDDQQGWVIVEATPPDGTPETNPAPLPKQFLDYLREGFLSLRIQLQQGYIRIALRALFQSRAFLVTLLSLFVYVLYRSYRRRTPTSRRRKIPDPRVDELQRLLKKMDARMRKHKLQRSAGETLHQFADRVARNATDQNLEAAALWYRCYADARYGGDSTPESLKHLENGLKPATS
ncbi:Protein-glutamine gamma-glutamyltransferase [Symmachiella macrocystis]|uniref:Protein-glutamine gamma-glutamyltransferase n=1 Tax=Symmachiella macrocystis TaxID=2527985 RepID=A0A5C6BGV0_9PLAN|nr:transglutaminase domain-containing protein [Symmachiella macrocystis]TWU09674.1 Protein-glutamine gamma-glutamyltransferase [Symmachiella macrocystis]